MGAYYHMLKQQSTQKKNTWAGFLAFDLADYIVQLRDFKFDFGCMFKEGTERDFNPSFNLVG